MPFLCFIKYSHSYFLGIVPITPTALFLYYAFYYIAIFKSTRALNLLDFDSSKIKQALGSGMLQQINNLYL